MKCTNCSLQLEPGYTTHPRNWLEFLVCLIRRPPAVVSCDATVAKQEGWGGFPLFSLGFSLRKNLLISNNFLEFQAVIGVLFIKYIVIFVSGLKSVD